jgi:organic radical activating enzyme
MIDKYFPIKTDTSCQLKWTWSTIQLYTGKTNSCHRVDHSEIEVDNFDSFHNTPKKLSDRKLMLQGQWPSGGCEYCKNIEQAGGTSDRMFQLQIPNLVPKELEVDPTAIEVTPKIVEVYLDNVCNMSCIYCWDGFSSKIQAENNKFGKFEKDGLIIENYATKIKNFDAMSAKFWEWMSKNYSELRRLHILGGEPLYQAQFETCLLFLENNKNPNLEFNIVTNLKVNPERLRTYVERIKKLVDNQQIARFDVTCSIDCWGDEQEYIRYGINMSEWIKNFDYLVGQNWIFLNINQTITGIGIKSIPDLLKFINQRRTPTRQIGQYFMACVNQSHLYPGIFGKGFFDKDFENIFSVMPDDTWQHKHAKKMMQGLQLEFNSQNKNLEEIKKLKIFLDEMDRRRHTDWRNTFPWLEKEMTNVV